MRSVRRRLLVHAFAQRDRGEFLVSGFFLVEIGSEETDYIIVTKRFGPCDERPVPGDLIVLYGLRSSDDCSIEHILVSDLTGYFICFLDQPIDRGTLPLRRLAELAEYLIKPFDLPVRLFQMLT